MTIKAWLKNEEKKRSKDVGTPVSQAVGQATPALGPSQTPAPAALSHPAPKPSTPGGAADVVTDIAAVPRASEQADAAPGEAILSVEVRFLSMFVHTVEYANQRADTGHRTDDPRS